MNQKNFERSFCLVILIIYAVIGYFVYQKVLKPGAKATLQFLNASNATFQGLPSQPKSHK